jgi:hypothetical protein
MGQYFAQYFFPAQFFAGLVMAVRMATEGYIDSGWLTMLAWGVGGFFVVVPFTAGYALVRAGLYRRKMRRLGLEPALRELWRS